MQKYTQFNPQTAALYSSWLLVGHLDLLIRFLQQIAGYFKSVCIEYLVFPKSNNIKT